MATPSWGIAPVLKANAYGHGLLEIARIVDRHPHVPFIVVDSYFEALKLRNEHIRTQVLVIGHTLTHNIEKNALHDVAFTISSLSQLKELAHNKKSKRVVVHLKFDTGMHRQGIMPKELERAIEIVQQHPHLHVAGLCSHLADADGFDTVMTDAQIATWNDIVRIWRDACPQTQHYHLSATAGVQYHQHIDATVGRLGIGLYGVSDVVAGLEPVLSMTTTITALRVLQAGERVGYGATWRAQRQSRIATVPVGYFEGVDRRLSNRGMMRVRDVLCPIVGRVSMNMTTIDVTDVTDAVEGDVVEVISSDSEAPNSIAQMATACETIPYELLVHLPTTLKRIVV